jgi:hypothetical protein
MDSITLQKMIFIYNSINKGWKVHKRNNSYVFSKKHENKKEVFLDDYLKKFILENYNIEDF